ncbi:hypothetical protein HYR99_06175 [Candidatus Poribacteria bacterium]|nr:hypothetical protein [Candidatus Poribacteria bacterium]
MSIDFLRNKGAHRVRSDETQPFLLDDGMVHGMVQSDNGEDEPKVGLDYEVEPGQWKPRDVTTLGIPSDWPLRPERFVDGKDMGRTVAWLQSEEGYPIPVRLSEIGAVVMRRVNGTLRREFHRIERVVSMMVDFFSLDDGIEGFANALRAHGFRFLPCRAPDSIDSFYNFDKMRRATKNRSNDEMLRLERQALARESDVPTIVDGRLEPHAGAFDDALAPVVGLIKTHWRNYLHPGGWRVYYDLQPGQRTPAFRLETHNLSVVSWYLRLDGARGELPNYGIVRLEIPERFFGDELDGDWGYIDCLSRLVCEYRCRDQSYGRAAVSIYPIQRAEESLGSLFTHADSLIHHFYRLTRL